MASRTNGDCEQAEGTPYVIRVQGHINDDWSDWFGGMRIVKLPGGETLLHGTVVDQAALHGLLATIRDLGLPLIEVTPVQTKG